MTAIDLAIPTEASILRRDHRIRNFALAGFSGLMICWLAAWSWHGEEPSALRTWVVATGIYSIAVLVTIFSIHCRWISMPGFWLLAFAAKLLLSVTLTQFAWFEPLAPDLMRVSEVEGNPGLEDSNLYDYYALQAAQQGIGRSWDTLNFTWLSFGITGYLALIYAVLGVSIAYVSMCNALCSLIGLIMLSATLRMLFGAKRTWNLVALAAFIPSVAFYDATPAKEPLTNVFYYMALFALTAFAWRGRMSAMRLIQVLISLALLSIVRSNVTMMLIATNAWPMLKRIGLWRAVATGSICMVLAAIMLASLTGSMKSFYTVFDLQVHFQQTQGFVQERADAGESGLKQVVAEKLAPSGVGNLLLWAPLRAVIWFYLPYPLLMPSAEGITPPPTLLYEARLKKVRAVHEQAFVLTGWLLILATPFLIGAFWAAVQRRHPGLQMLIFNIAGSAIIIGNLMFIMGRRYRTLIEPLIFATVLVAAHYRLGRKLIWPTYIAMISGVVLAALLRS
jgi:hypothetical protein